MHPVIDDADAQEQRGRDKAVADHLKDCTVQALLVEGKDPHRDKAHVGHGGIGDQLFHILLHQCHERGVDDRNRRHPQHQWRQHVRAHREHRYRETQEAVAAHLKQDRRKHDRPRGRCLNVRIWQPRVDRPHRHFNRKTGKERQEHHGLQSADHSDPRNREGVGREGMRQKTDFAASDARRARIRIHHHHRHQHQDRPEEGVEEELERCINTVRPAPDANNQEHRDQTCLEEQVEEHEIQRHEHAQHQRLEKQEGDHVFLDPRLYVPAGSDDQRHHKRGQHHKQDRNAVNAQTVLKAHQPLCLVDKLEAGVGRVKVEQNEQRDQERDCCGDQCQPFCIAPRRGVFAPQEHSQNKRRKAGHEGNDGKQVMIH